MSRRQTIRILSLLLTVCCVAVVAWRSWKAFAAAKTWTGAGISNPDPAFRNNSWTNRFNWSGNAVPVAGDDLVFGGSAQPVSQNNFPSGTSFESINIGGGHTITGNSLALNSGIIATSGTIATGTIKLNNGQTFNAPLANQGATIGSAIDTTTGTLTLAGAGTFVLSGAMSGTASIQKKDSGLAVLSGNNTYTGTTFLTGGTLIINGSQPQSHVVQVDGILGGGGTIGDLSVNSMSGTPSKVSPGNPNNGTAVLTVGDLQTINNGLSTFYDFDLNGTTAGSGYDQLNVIGTVDLGFNPSTLQLGLGFALPLGSSFVLIKNDGTDPISHIFAGLPEGATIDVNDITFVISYKGGDGNDVVLHVQQTKTWDGGGTTNNWSDAANWVGDVAPSFGDSLEFPAGAARLNSVNNFAANTVFNSITFSGGGYNFGGNGIALNAGINETAVGNVINLPILLTRSQSFVASASGSLLISSVNLGDKTLTLDGGGNCNFQGAIAGSGAVTRTGTGASRFNADNSYTGLTTINSGTLTVEGVQSNSPVNLNNGVLTGQGIVGTLAAEGGKVSPGPQAMTVSGNVTLKQSTTLEIKTFGGGGASFFTFLNVNGAVNIANSTLAVLPPPAPVTTPSSIIVANDGSDPVTGTFAGLPEGAILTAGTHQFRISYVGGDGNDVVLMRVPVTRRWDGGSSVNSNWTTKENWEGDVAPIAGDNLEFPEGAARKFTVNDFAVNTVFNSITLSGGGFHFNGNGIALNAGITDTVVSGNANLVDLPIVLTASQSFSTLVAADRALSLGAVNLGDKSLTLDGAGHCNIRDVIAGTGSVLRVGIGASQLSGTNTYTGSTTINSGTLDVDRNQPSSPINLNNGKLSGRGTVGSLVAVGGVVSPGTLGTPTLTVAGSVVLNPSVTLEINRQNLNPNPLGRLDVNGTVNITGSTLAFGPLSAAPNSPISIIVSNDGSDPIIGTFAGLAEGAMITASGFQFQISYVGGDGNDITVTSLSSLIPTLQFQFANFPSGETTGVQFVDVVRTGDPSAAVTVDYRTADTDNFTVGCADAVNNQGGAFGRCDFATAVGTLNFAANVTQQRIGISIINDAIPEGIETFQVVLENPVGATLGALSTATVTINANDLPGLPNPIFQSPFFVRQHYLDFLSREPEQDGFDAWLRVLNGCPDVNNLDPNSASAQCDRIIVSQSFFGSLEFQIKGFYVFRFYKLAHNRLPEYLEIISDMSFVAGATQQEVFDRKAQLVNRFMQRQEFLTTYGSLSNSAFVNALMSRYQLTQVTTADPQQPDGNQKVTFTVADLTNRLNAATLTRAQVFRAIADSDQVSAAEFNNAFVATQYYGYLRRKPDSQGFNDWLNVLQSGNIRLMINGFMNSQEYRLRFGPPQ